MDKTNTHTKVSQQTISNENSKILYLRLLSFAKPYLGYFFLSLLGFMLFASMETAMAHLMKYFINGLESRDASLVYFIPAAIVIARLAHGIGSFLGNFFIARVGLNVVNDLRKKVFAHMMYLPVAYYHQNNSGEIVSLIIYNIQQITGSVTDAVKIAFRDGFTVLGLIAYMFYANWQLTLVFLIIAPILGWLVNLASRYFRKVSRKMQVTMGNISHIANESVQGSQLVKSYNGQTYEIKRFDDESDENTKLGTKYERISAIQGPVYHLVIALSLAIISLLILTLWDGDTGSAIAYLTAAGMIAKPIRQLSSVNEKIQKGLAASETIFAALDTPQEEKNQQPSLVVTSGKIAFKKVSFGYEDEKEAINTLSLEVIAGSTIALVGPSGSGKSTLANLLLRFYEANSGHIEIDNTDISTVSLESLRENIGLVNQQTILFNDSIYSNIAYGESQNSIDKEKVVFAAQKANAYDFIQALPKKFESIIGESGAKLSGGQRQRLAIARAIYKNAPILILDEATSALDNESEKLIQEALNELQKDRTTIVIAHRLSTIESADKIVVIDQGNIVEQGSHDELVALKGHYAALRAANFSQ